jgi:hypothetical protein
LFRFSPNSMPRGVRRGRGRGRGGAPTRASKRQRVPSERGAAAGADDDDGDDGRDSNDDGNDGSNSPQREEVALPKKTQFRSPIFTLRRNHKSRTKNHSPPLLRPGEEPLPTVAAIAPAAGYFRCFVLCAALTSNL